MNGEVESWKRWFAQNQKNLEDIRYQAQHDNQKVMTAVRQHINATHKNLDELHKNQIHLDKDGDVVKKMCNEQNETMANLNSMVELANLQMKRLREDYSFEIEKLQKRIDKAEEDRMAKYYT